ncbi:unnamed protein product [Zymoseptoria tritici ST99CH_3D7]|uniref:Uncharacterized protein n=1 Tax=Zymoseptoria tritici (strain ST99CH_3D7) TaxID=1276538 RepID=A0A1X7RHV7_ZYMT9|nr:unnamed protein product [Zymoseptoria tritici ST99CH_3D7]
MQFASGSLISTAGCKLGCTKAGRLPCCIMPTRDRVNGIGASVMFQGAVSRKFASNELQSKSSRFTSEFTQSTLGSRIARFSTLPAEGTCEVTSRVISVLAELSRPILLSMVGFILAVA